MEIENKSFVFQVDSNIIKNTYLEDNFLIEYNELCLDHNICSIYFSSNDIYFPNTEEAFTERIIKKDSYEWYNNRIKVSYKNIFIRDIQKQWYIAGINYKVNTPKLLLDFLRKETKGYSIITVGSSAGGYAAVLYGSLLEAKKVLSFNGQHEIKSLLQTSNPIIDPLIFRMADSEAAKYFDLKDFINPNINIYYFVSLKSAWDYQQYVHIKNLTSVNSILFETSHHGIPFIKSALPIVINMPKSQLNMLTAKKHHPLLFSIRYAGLFNTVESIYFQMKGKLFKGIKTFF